jgi:ABC-type transport system substrate-binding protein
MGPNGPAVNLLNDTSSTTPPQRHLLAILTIKATLLLAITFMGSYQKEKWANRTEFRKAMVLAIDMKSPVKRVFPEGTGTRYANGHWSERALGYDPKLPLYPYNPAESRNILQDIQV